MWETRVRFPGREDPWRKWQPTPVFLPGKSHDGGAWRATAHRVAKSQTQLSDFTFTFSSFSTTSCPGKVDNEDNTVVKLGHHRPSDFKGAFVTLQ